LLAGQEKIRLGRLDPRRDMTYVADTVDGFVRAATADGIAGRTIQLGTGRDESISDLFAMACRAAGVEARPVLEEARLRPDASEVAVLRSDPGLARELLGWQATTSLEEGLAATIAWLRSHPDPDPARVQL
jgi:UDP-glucose 4-epimerase